MIRKLVCGVAVGLLAAAALAVDGYGVEKSTASLKVAWNYQGECALTNENPFSVRIGEVKIYDSSGAVKASAYDLVIGPEQTRKISVLGLNDRYHCDAAGFHPHPEDVCIVDFDHSLARNVRMILDVISNGSSIATAEGRFVRVLHGEPE